MFEISTRLFRQISTQLAFNRFLVCRSFLTTTFAHGVDRVVSVDQRKATWVNPSRARRPRRCHIRSARRLPAGPFSTSRWLCGTPVLQRKRGWPMKCVGPSLIPMPPWRLPASVACSTRQRPPPRCVYTVGTCDRNSEHRRCKGVLQTHTYPTQIPNRAHTGAQRATRTGDLRKPHPG